MLALHSLSNIEIMVRVIQLTIFNKFEYNPTTRHTRRPYDTWWASLFSAWESCERATKRWTRVATHLRCFVKKVKSRKTSGTMVMCGSYQHESDISLQSQGFLKRFCATGGSGWVRRDFVIRAFCLPQRKYTRAVFFFKFFPRKWVDQTSYQLISPSANVILDHLRPF